MEIYTLACSIYESKVDDVYIFRCTTNPHSKQAREVFPLSFLSLVGPTPQALSIGAFPNPSPWHPTRVETESDPIKTLARGPRERSGSVRRKARAPPTACLPRSRRGPSGRAATAVSPSRLVSLPQGARHSHTCVAIVSRCFFSSQLHLD